MVLVCQQSKQILTIHVFSHHAPLVCGSARPEAVKRSVCGVLEGGSLLTWVTFDTHRGNNAKHVYMYGI